MAKILVVEDERALSDVVLDYLGAQNYNADHVADGKEALDRLKFYSYDLVILDWNLPNMEGPDICKAFRASGGTTPILMLTGKRDIDDREYGLDSGADDYLTKPFHMKELGARVRALLRRPAAVVSKDLSARDITLDPTTHRVCKGGQDLDILPKEFALLEFLLRHPRQVFSAEALIERVWPTDSEASSGTIRTYVNRLRSKIDTKGQDSLITTVHGIGYRLDPE
jgi:DNA-binding response OmpR family regulator